MISNRKPWRLIRRASAAATTVALAAVVAACGSSGGSTASGASSTGARATGGSGGSSLDLSGVTLKVGYQTADFPALLKASGLFEDTPYKFQIPVIAGPANQLAALYGKQIDVGQTGENTAAFEAANSATPWPADGAPIQGFAVTWTPQAPYPAAVYVTKKSGITSLAGLRGKKIGFNYGGNIYAEYVIALQKGGFALKDVQGVQFPSNQAAANAFLAGSLDAVVTSYSIVKKLVDSGDAIKIADNNTLGIIGGSGWIARTDALKDPAKLAAIKDFYGRLRTFYEKWIPTHEADYEKVLVSQVGQRPDVAKVNWENARHSTFYRIGDPKFLQIQQATVDAAFGYGGLKTNVRSRLGWNYSTVLDGVTTGTTG
ncbi:Sulfonate transport system substrate-binding protein [Frankia canadensis]|uniref:Sulfonate transport system substrate-binding protein n=1 Tax=Frankia canadensis TaxID=1836972 RepID=A0A2I2KWQ6_9ACTN|nr:ABC transporter substrate-binding protein [Frankia canadensis]SNQ50086.1 Sulfonate transport system substrate-binding protein [Frankia canadensis]SOU57376.1 Sulfonate transport system substrate-binding protein [Frankia canadensis]